MLAVTPLALVCLARPCAAETQRTDAATLARIHLVEGYRLRKSGRCPDAIPHLEESVRLDAQVKALLNLADCEEQLHDWISAAVHFRAARALAEATSDPQVAQEASDRLKELEQKLPRAGSAPALAAAPPTAPLSKDEEEPAPLALPPRPSPAAPSKLRARPGGERVQGRTQLYFGVASGALGALSLGFGVLQGLTALRLHEDAVESCRGNCEGSREAQRLQARAQSAAAFSTAGFVSGALLTVSSVALLWTAPSNLGSVRTGRRSLATPAPPRGIDFSPWFGASMTGVRAEGVW
jgi:tetratricopeptide (TPR) repeat protein